MINFAPLETDVWMVCTSCGNSYAANPLNTNLEPGSKFTAWCWPEGFKTLHVISWRDRAPATVVEERL